MLNQLHIAEVMDPNGRVQKRIEEYTNTKLDIRWAPSAGYDEQVNLLIASNDLPMMTVIRDNKQPTILQGVKNNMFWEVGPYLERFENLKVINPEIEKSIAYWGKTYGLYRWREFVRSGFIYRKDWLNKLGLKEPTNLDELYNVIRAFSEDDPDGNGKRDTFGIAKSPVQKLEWHAMVLFHGGDNEWTPDGKGGVIPTFMTQPWIDAMDWFRKCYVNGYMNQDYPTASKNTIYEHWWDGSAGLFYMSMYDAVSVNVMTPFQKAFPGVEHDVVSRIYATDGTLRLYPTAGYNGIYMFSKRAIRDEDALMGCLNFLDKLSDGEMQDFLAYGYEGEHYRVLPDGRAEMTNQEAKTKEFGSFGQLEINYAKNVRPAVREPLREKIDQMVIDNDPYGLVNIASAYMSDTYTALGSILDQIIYDARDLYIAGRIDLPQFQAMINNWRAQGGDKVIEEYSKEYREAGGK